MSRRSRYRQWAVENQGAEVADANVTSAPDEGPSGDSGGPAPKTGVPETPDTAKTSAPETRNTTTKETRNTSKTNVSETSDIAKGQFKAVGEADGGSSNALDGGESGTAELDGSPVPFVGDLPGVELEKGKLPHPDVFNAYPPELQLKILEWMDRGVRARSDDESRRQDERLRAEIDGRRRRQVFPMVIALLAVICAAVTGVITANPLFSLLFLLVPIAMIVVRIVSGSDNGGGRRNGPPKL